MAFQENITLPQTPLHADQGHPEDHPVMRSAAEPDPPEHDAPLAAPVVAAVPTSVAEKPSMIPAAALDPYFQIDGPCCALAICCPPESAAEVLGTHIEPAVTADGEPVEETYAAIAFRFLSEFVLVPRELKATPAFVNGGPAQRGTHRLEKLHEHIAKELKEILPDLGYALVHEDKEGVA